MSPELIMEVRRYSTQTNLRAQRIEKELERRTTSTPPAEDENEPTGEAE